MKARYKILLINLVISVLFLFIFEVAIRFYISPSESSSGTLLGRELPPVTIVPVKAPPEIVQPSLPYGLTVDGAEITIGDLAGFRQEEPVIGYEPKPNSHSANGWWFSNNIGARSETDTTAKISNTKKRLLVFGDSFAQASRVPQNEAWTEVLQLTNPTLEVVNLGVDGYSIAQAYLRFRKITRHTDYDIAALIFVPKLNLWRDINTIRYLGERWPDYQIMPRYILNDENLELISSPYQTREEFYRDNYLNITDQTRSHLLKYDRFYYPLRHENPRVVGGLVSYKILALIWSELRYARTRQSTMDLDGEALEVSREIFKTMNRDVRQGGKRFFLILVPTTEDLENFRGPLREMHLSVWSDFVNSVCSDEIRCLDLGSEFKDLSPDVVDSGYDGTHFGPLMNLNIAKAVADYLSQM